MKSLVRIALPLSLICLAAAPQPGLAQEGASAGINAADYIGKMIYTAKGERIGAVYKVGQDGAAQVIVSGKMVTIPAATLNLAEGKLQTTLDKRTIMTAR
ncbi:MAG: PRC-barrel domain-containing protein [Novosphingobium meiothermophilum]